YVTDEELPRLYRNARALLIPSLYEGFGLPIVEAFSQATPVMTSDRGAMREIAGDGALLVNPEDVSELASGLLKLTEDRGFVGRLKLCAHARARRFCWKRAATQTLDVMDSLLNG